MRTVGGIAVLLALLLAGGAAAYVAYFETPDIPATAPAGITRAPLAKRAFLFIIDGFAADPPIPEGSMPTFSRLGREGAHGIARTSSMSLTAPCVFSLGTGRPGTLTLGIQDFHAPPVHVESIPSLVVAAGKRIALAGDPSWDRQFGWLTVAGDTHDHPEPGCTLDPRVRVADKGSVEFLIPKLRDPAYGLLVVHVSSADAVGHVVTPFGKEYRDALTFVDGLLEEALRGIDGETVVLVTGDHGMGPRGTHGGRDDAATLTPYVLWGPGVRAGATADVAQTALPTTLAVLLGVPMPTGETPPATELLAIDARAEAALRGEFLDRKLAAARALAPDLTLAAESDLRAANARLNEILFGSGDRRVGWRLLTAAIFALAAVLALVFARHSATAHTPQPSIVALLTGALAVPVAFAAIASLVITWRSALPFQPDVLAALAAALLGCGGGLCAVALYRSPGLREGVRRSELALYFGAALLLVTPLITSGWGTPEKYFQVLTVTLVGGGIMIGSRMHDPRKSSAPGWISMSLLSAGYYGKGFSSTLPSEWMYLAPALAAVLAMALWNLVGLTRTWRSVATMILLAGMAAAVWWKTSGDVMAAAVVLGAFLAAAACALSVRTDPMAAAGLIIGASASLALIMASDSREALVFLAAALAALVLTRQRLPLTQPRALYFAAVAALVLRVWLYFALGDHYSLSSIRTAAGFRLVESGLALPWVIVMLLLKYTIPWLLILAAALPSLVAGGRSVTQHAIRLLGLGYVARFLAVAAVADPFRVLPHGMEGLVGVFAISWAELLTLAAAGTLVLALTPVEGGASPRHRRLASSI